MYHYVRPHDAALPFFRHLEVDDFCAQLDAFSESHHWVCRDELLEALRQGKPVENGALLTFDDGFSDHYRYVFPELRRRNIPGIFYVPTSPLTTGKLLEVHRTHLLLGRHGGQKIFERLQSLVTEKMLSHQHVTEFLSLPYRFQTNDEWTVAVKRTLNYLIDYSARPQVMETLMREFLPDEADLAREFYLTRDQFQEMHEKGMIIGSHTVNHPCMSKLSGAEQRQEIQESFALLEEVLGPLPLKTFCYPYGGAHSFTSQTEELLREFGCHFSFSVEYRDVTSEDLLHRPQALPRYDCNMVSKLLKAPGQSVQK
jgi:peptidoglycan/xylan/chitin deacetylase (PgdA/CDA1 family)